MLKTNNWRHLRDKDLHNNQRSKNKMTNPTMVILASVIVAFFPIITNSFMSVVPSQQQQHQQQHSAVFPKTKHNSFVIVSSSFITKNEGTTGRESTTLLSSSNDPFSSSDFGSSDFGTAMPPKPVMTIEEKLLQSATEFIVSLESQLSAGVRPPPELENLREARDDETSTKQYISQCIYELMIERGMLYDIDPTDNTLSPTNFNIQDNLAIPEVQKEFKFLYDYGMKMIKNGLIEGEVCKKIVVERLVKRTGLTPEEFDEWLGF